MGTVATIKSKQSELVKLRYATPWEEIKEDNVYHIPPILTLNRRDVIIISKNDDEAIYRKIGDKENHKMHKMSVFARFLIKRKKF